MSKTEFRNLLKFGHVSQHTVRIFSAMATLICVDRPREYPKTLRRLSQLARERHDCCARLQPILPLYEMDGNGMPILNDLDLHVVQEMKYMLGSPVGEQEPFGYYARAETSIMGVLSTLMKCRDNLHLE